MAEEVLAGQNIMTAASIGTIVLISAVEFIRRWFRGMSSDSKSTDRDEATYKRLTDLLDNFQRQLEQKDKDIEQRDNEWERLVDINSNLSSQLDMQAQLFHSVAEDMKLLIRLFEHFVEQQDAEKAESFKPILSPVKDRLTTTISRFVAVSESKE